MLAFDGAGAKALREAGAGGAEASGGTGLRAGGAPDGPGDGLGDDGELVAGPQPAAAAGRPARPDVGAAPAAGAPPGTPADAPDGAIDERGPAVGSSVSRVARRER
ncbi:MAG: hypothetical protein B7X40_06830 [Cellulomonas sp. 14-74-6]|nr:MAG: hypothetical protein B7X40_06830 [Cellulomonas sp. 14-74-6]